jgi:hypothetical protein
MSAMIDGLEFVRVSTGSQDETTQIRDLDDYAGDHNINVKKRVVLHGYSASHGTQEPAIREAIEGIREGRWSLIMVTDSSRLDRREDLDAQAEILLAIRQAGGDVVSITEPQYGKTDFAGRIVTLVAQYGNAQKSRVVKDSTWRGIRAIIENKAFHGPLPMYWAASGVRYSKVAVCTNPEAVRAIYEAVRDGASLSAIGREHDTYPHVIRNLIRTRANMTGAFTLTYTYNGQPYTWQHRATDNPPVDTALWHAANEAVDERGRAKNNLGSRPIRLAKSWISGLLSCPRCGGNIYILRGKTLRCAGRGKDRRGCGVHGISLASVVEQLTQFIDREDIEIYRYQKVRGNRGELAQLHAELDDVRGRLAVTDDDSEFDALSGHRKELRTRIAEFVIVDDSYEMTLTGETLSEFWRSGDKREIFKALQRYINFYFRDDAGLGQVWFSEREGYPGGTLIELGPDTCVKFPEAEWRESLAA